jgi:hypothetical protein
MGYTREYLTRPQMKKRPGRASVWRASDVLCYPRSILSYIGGHLVEMNTVENLACCFNANITPTLLSPFHIYMLTWWRQEF